MYDEDALLPISALQHMLFCERQCALIHIEGLWSENRFTAEGQNLHRKAHGGPDETRDGVRIARGLRLRSLRLGLTGQADVVEFAVGGGSAADRRAFPVEYKRGRPKSHRADEVQLCAQALCLEEVLGISVPAGALYYGETRRRTEVAFDDVLRALTEEAGTRLHKLIRSGRTPRTVREPKCDHCSLLELCLPDVVGPGRDATEYVERALAESLAATDTGEAGR
jgi:CRISPR-associated exonuclease Cas4